MRPPHRPLTPPSVHQSAQVRQHLRQQPQQRHRLQLRQRAQLAVSEAQAQSQLEAAYRQLRAQLAPALHAFLARYTAALDALRAETGDPHAALSPAWLHDRGATGGQVDALRQTVQAHVATFAHQAEQLVRGAVADAGSLGSHAAQEQLTQALAPIAALVPPSRILKQPSEA